jgi:ABC-type uncharacterized transport system ATPase subunit/ABC-type branched-subunit amino acid transport system permease subunit
VSARALNLLGLGLVGIVGVTFLIVTPRFAELDTVLELTIYMIMAILALSLALIWGYGGILCFGQSAFFGLGAYTYAIAMFNIGESTVPLLLAILLPAGFAALLGYFMFYGRISDVYLGVITLTVTLILFNSVNSTAGPEFHLGVARLGGFNGIPGIPPLNYPGNKAAVIDLEGMFYLATAALLATYFGLRLLLASRFGRIIVGIRENERRAELLGYDPRAYKLATFTIGGALAGFAGCLFANWGNFVSPTIFGLAQSAQIIIWVIVGGRGTLIGPIVGCIGIQWLTTALGANQPSGSDWWTKLLANAPLILGIILIAFVLLVPKGLVPTLGDFGQWLLGSRTRRIAASLKPKRAEELRCLIGPNGAGKSTFFKMLTGQLQPSQGQVLFRGHDISNAHAHQIARLGIGIKTQVPSVFDGLSVRENIWLAAGRIHSSKRVDGVVDEMLERIGLTGAANRLVGQLAHGQRQWAELGIVLSTDPELILLDEPAAGMTHEEVYKTAELVREINRSKALIVVEHDMQFIRMIAKQVTVFNQGSVLVEDAVENILRNPLVRDIYLGKQAAA